MDLVGYTDRLAIAPGETLTCMVSCRERTFSASLVRLRHGDRNPLGPGARECRIRSSIDGTYPGIEQWLHPGSYGMVDEGVPLDARNDLGIVLWAMPTLDEARVRTLICARTSDGGGWSLTLDEAGRPTFGVVGEDGAAASVALATGLTVRAWHRLAAGFDATSRRLWLSAAPAGRGASPASSVEGPGIRPAAGPAPIVLGAWLDGARPCEAFNGKLESPALFGRRLGAADLERLDAGAEPWELAHAPVAAWDLGAHPEGTRFAEVIAGRDGTLVNQPGRAVTGRRFTGTVLDWRAAPSQYGAVRFHDDDLENAGWEPSLSFTAPADLASGLYAIRLQGSQAVERLPFVVGPQPGNPSSALVLAPTLTWRAYANEHQSWLDPQTGTERPTLRHAVSAADRYAAAHVLTSLYDRHRDGSGTVYASLLRPQATIRPELLMPALGVPHALAADLYLLDWLEQRGTRYDVAADETLHAEGRGLLDRYPVVITGTHPEYWTEAMLDALTGYVDAGGRVMYLGGNGFYWVATLAPGRPHLLEVRRGSAGTGPFHGEAGEGHHSATGEPGGLWRSRGRAPQQLVGVGFAAMGASEARPYVRAPDLPERARFVFEGVSADAAIGARALGLGAAAAIEIDRADHALGTAADAIVLASATGFTAAYTPASEDLSSSVDPRALVRADLVLVENAAGGAVFSAGSIGWTSALSQDGYDNAVSRITGNVLDHFSARAAVARLDTLEAVR